MSQTTWPQSVDQDDESQWP